MKGILILEITTSAPKDLLSRDNISIMIGADGMSWKPEIDQFHFMETELEQEEKQAVPNRPKAVNYPFNMGMHLGMSLVGEAD